MMPRKVSKVQKVRAQKAAKAIMESNTLKEAYAKLHPNATPDSVGASAYRLLENPLVIEQLNKYLDSQKSFDVHTESLKKVLSMVVGGWLEGVEETKDLIRVVELLSKLCPEFVDRKEVNAYSKMSKDDLDRLFVQKLRGLGQKNPHTSDPSLN